MYAAQHTFHLIEGPAKPLSIDFWTRGNPGEVTFKAVQFLYHLLSLPYVRQGVFSTWSDAVEARIEFIDGAGRAFAGGR